MQDPLQNLQYRLERAERRFRMLGGLALIVVLGGMALASRPAATAQIGAGGIPARVEALEKKVAALQTVNTTLQANLDAEIAARKQGDADTLAAAKAYTDQQVANEAAARKAADAAIETEIAALQLKTQFITVDGTDMAITGANLHILNGMGTTSTLNGLGNLIVGYNGSRVPFGGTDVRTRSHNIIAGDYNNYSAYGGQVIGFANTILNSYASVSGGQGNTASGSAASVSGGINNIASGNYSSVSGGIFNEAGNFYSSVSGGSSNLAGGDSASVSGGYFNYAGGGAASVSGGWSNTANDFFSSVSGGYLNYASGAYSSVSGGASNTASNGFSSVSGGANNTASGSYSSVSGGYQIVQSILFGWSAGTQGATTYSGVFRSP